VRAVVCAVCPDEVKAQLIDPHMMPDGCGYAPPVNVVELIEAVILHPDAKLDFAEEVAAFCTAHKLPAPIPSAMASRPQFGECKPSAYLATPFGANRFTEMSKHGTALRTSGGSRDQTSLCR
jgi:hypothetical protein